MIPPGFKECIEFASKLLQNLVKGTVKCHLISVTQWSDVGHE